MAPEKTLTVTVINPNTGDNPDNDGALRITTADVSTHHSKIYPAFVSGKPNHLVCVFRCRNIGRDNIQTF
jgi:hypothetical protein